MSRYLVTGGAGFIGSHLSETLLRQGHDVVVLDDFSSGKRENIEELQKVSNRLRVIEGNVADARLAAEAVKGVEAVFHQAAVGSVPKSVAEPMVSHEANVTGTLVMLMAARDAKVKCFVNAASSSAYGDTPELPKRETMVPNCFSPYAVTKLAQEQYCRAFFMSYGLHTVSLRYFNVYGPRQDPTSQYAAVIPKFFDSFLRGKAPTIYGDGEQTRDFTFVADVVDANIKASKFPGEGQVFNIAGGKRITVNELARQAAQLVGTSVKPEHVAARAGDIRHSLADIREAQTKIQFDPKTPLEEGLRITFEWYRKRVTL